MSHKSPLWTNYEVRPHAQIRWHQRVVPHLTQPIDLQDAVRQTRFWGRWGHLYVQAWGEVAFLFYWRDPELTGAKNGHAVLTTVWPLQWVERKAARSPEGA